MKGRVLSPRRPRGVIAETQRQPISKEGSSPCEPKASPFANPVSPLDSGPQSHRRGPLRLTARLHAGRALE